MRRKGRRHRTKGAAVWLAAALALAGCSGRRHFERALECEAQGRYAQAVEHLDAAIAREPDFYEAYVNRGMDKSELGDLRGAIADYTAAIGISPSGVSPYVSRATARRRSGDLPGAVADCDEALRRMRGAASGPVRVRRLSLRRYLYLRRRLQEPRWSECDVYLERGIAYALADSLSHALRDLERAAASPEAGGEARRWLDSVRVRLKASSGAAPGRKR